jgi:hypothetical protein
MRDSETIPEHASITVVIETSPVTRSKLSNQSDYHFSTNQMATFPTMSPYSIVIRFHLLICGITKKKTRLSLQTSCELQMVVLGHDEEWRAFFPYF